MTAVMMKAMTSQPFARASVIRQDQLASESYDGHDDESYDGNNYLLSRR